MGTIKYIGQPWTNDNTSLMALYYLGVSAKVLPQFRIIPGTTKLVSSTRYIISTLSPEDPNSGIYKRTHSSDSDGSEPGDE